MRAAMSTTRSFFVLSLDEEPDEDDEVVVLQPARRATDARRATVPRAALRMVREPEMRLGMVKQTP
jgi:hypothetical protein